MHFSTPKNKKTQGSSRLFGALHNSASSFWQLTHWILMRPTSIKREVLSLNLNDWGVHVIYNLEENMQIRSSLIIKGPVSGWREKYSKSRFEYIKSELRASLVGNYIKAPCYANFVRPGFYQNVGCFEPLNELPRSKTLHHLF